MMNPRASAPLPVRGVVFDMDGTLVTSELDFARIRAEAAVPDGVPILEYMERLDEAGRRRVGRVLEEHEELAARRCELLPGAAELLAELRARGVKLALLTRNSERSMQMVLERFGLSFDCCLAREHAEPKPSPDAIFKIAGRLGLRAGDLLVVGDYIFDVQAGQNAGARTALLYTGRDYALEPPADFVLGGLLDVLNHVPVGPAVEAGG